MVLGVLGAGGIVDAADLLSALYTLFHDAETAPTGVIGTSVHDFVSCPDCKLNSRSEYLIEDVITVYVGFLNDMPERLS